MYKIEKPTAGVIIALISFALTPSVAATAEQDQISVFPPDIETKNITETQTVKFEEVVSTYLRQRNIKRLQQLHDYLLDNNIRDENGTAEIMTYYAVLNNNLFDIEICCGYNTASFLADWKKQYPQSAAPIIIENRFPLVFYGRGESLPEDAQKGMLAAIEENIAKNSTAFRSNAAGYEALILFTILKTWDEEKIYTILDEAFSAYPDTPIMALNSLRYADADSLYTTADIARRYGGEEVFAQVHLLASAWSQHAELAEVNKPSWPQIKRGLISFTGQYPSQYNFAAFWRFACQEDDSQQMTEITKQAQSNSVVLKLDQNNCSFELN